MATAALVWVHGPGLAGEPVRDVTYEEAAPVLDGAGAEAPQEIVALPSSDRPTAWARWVTRRKIEVTARLRRGEEDSLVPLLLFGTSYTKAPRITREFVERASRAAAAEGSGAAGAERAFAQAFAPRVDDLLRALQRPGTSERLIWARETLERLGHRLDAPEGRARAGRYLVENFARVTRESGELAKLADRARLFASRGLAPDTSWPINFALKASLESVASAGLLRPASVRRVAIVGPGLDFVDKDEGFDHYPPQSLQPFAVLDALVSLGLADRGAIQVVTLDVNPRVNAHLTRSREGGVPAYDLQLVRRAGLAWTPAAVRYFETFGAAVGREVTPAQAPAREGPLASRAVRVAPEWVRRVTPWQMDVVYERPVAMREPPFDLVIATNVLLYYSRLEQGLAARGIASVMRPGGLFITNTSLDDVPAFPLRRVHESTHVFSGRPGDGETLLAYAGRTGSER